MLVRQYDLQMSTFGVEPSNPLERADYIRWNVLALTDELHEALQEVSWKPWATDDFFNRDAYLGELVDAFHFLMNLVLAAYSPERQPGILDLAQEFFERYMDKAQVNKERQETPGGFKVLGTKCPDCGRAVEAGDRTPLADMQRVENNVIVYSLAYRCQCGRVNYLESVNRDAPAPG